MSFSLLAKKLDITSGGDKIVLLHESVALEHGIHAGDHIIVSGKGYPETLCIVDTTDSSIEKHHIGLYREVWEPLGIHANVEILLALAVPSLAVGYIKKKIKKENLTYEEIYAIMEGIVSGKLGLIEKTYFLTTIYNPGYSKEELYFLTKAMAETGAMLQFGDKVVDKHSIGGYAGKGITPLVVAIAASYGLKVPNTSSRSITTPAGTTDMLETIMPISFPKEKLEGLMQDIGAFLVWGGGLNLAPADEELIRIERPLGVESNDKFIVSILAKKVAMGVTHLLIDIPAGIEGKIQLESEIDEIERKFKEIGERFNMQITVVRRYPKGIDGNGVGPILEMREVLYVFENSPLKSKQLENDAVRLAGMLLEIASIAESNGGEYMAREALKSGKAYAKFKEIVKKQGGKTHIASADFTPKAKELSFKSAITGEITFLHNHKVIALARLLGCPLDHHAGIYFSKKEGDTVKIGDRLFTIYTTTEDRFALATAYLQKEKLFDIVPD